MEGLIIFLVIIVMIVTICFVIYIDYAIEKKELSYFKPGMILDFYRTEGHGKFKKEEVYASCQILDIDGKYAMVKFSKSDNATEINLSIDLKYHYKLVLKTKDGDIVKIFE